MSGTRATEPTYRLIDLHPDIDVDAAAEAFATEGWTFVGRGARCRINGVEYHRVSAMRIGRVIDPQRAKARDPKQPYDVPPGWDGPTAGASAPSR
ncbi:hypothetical protein [Phycicoccus sp. 3266]|uniref:hypothetical protein n=1 Tax=Phycicoccus sp. 3266 TaxID=2817751 RepID=UPI0028543865|nr:hypothetical protein [Phycicoccus sp. 3266]MDR6861994.1 hypothetical protein [Phycicoccus sp. 3266]